MDSAAAILLSAEPSLLDQALNKAKGLVNSGYEGEIFFLLHAGAAQSIPFAAFDPDKDEALLDHHLNKAIARHKIREQAHWMKFQLDAAYRLELEPFPVEIAVKLAGRAPLICLLTESGCPLEPWVLAFDQLLNQTGPPGFLDLSKNPEPLLQALEPGRPLPAPFNGRVSVILKGIEKLTTATRSELIKRLENNSIPPGLPKLFVKLPSDLKKIPKKLLSLLGEHQFRIPPLRMQLGNLPSLIEQFGRKISQETQLPRILVRREVYDLFKRYDWPRNQFELYEVLLESAKRANGEVLEVWHFNWHPGLAKAIRPISKANGVWHSNYNLKEARSKIIQEALLQAKGQRPKAAGLLGITRQALNQWEKKQIKLKP